MQRKAFIILFLLFATQLVSAQEKLIYHTIRTDKAGNILPWYNDDPGKSYSYVIDRIWNFWDTMRVDMNGLPYYMNHQVWRSDFNDPRGLGGDQIQMALSSWRLLYAYSGNERVKENMKFLADYYLSHGLSSSNSKWPNIPFPYNTLIYSGIYDGDMVIGKDFTQPDKAGSFGIELIHLYKMMSNERYPHATEKRYLDAAIDIANTLAIQVNTGDENNSPLPFKVNANTGEVGKLKNNSGNKSDAGLSSYTTNWSGTMELFLELIELKEGNVEVYQKSFDILLKWMKKYPMATNKWGPFFEDIPGWSDTQINAMTWARFIMNHQGYFPNWKSDVQKINEWVYTTLGNDQWKKYGVTVINEQTAYQTPSLRTSDTLDLFGSISQQVVRNEIDRIKNTFIHEVFTFQDERHLERYIQYHQQALIRLMDSTSNDYSDALYYGLSELLNFIEQHFSKYFDQDTKAPDGYVSVARSEARKNIQILTKALEERNVEPQTISVVLYALRRVVAHGKNITYRKVIYAKQVRSELYRLLNENVPNMDESIRQMTYYLNYNSLTVFAYHTRYLASLLQGEDSRNDKLEKLSYLLKTINQSQVRPGVRFNAGCASLKEQLSDYILEEIDYYQKISQLNDQPESTSPFVQNMKLRIDASVSQTACLLKILIENNLILNTNLTSTIKLISKIVVTKRSEILSYDSLRNKYYNVEQGTWITVRATLTKLIQYIDKSYL